MPSARTKPYTTEEIPDPPAGTCQEHARAWKAIRARFLQMGQPGSCVRCGGAGIRQDLEYWVVLSPKTGPGGKVCFRCHGSGAEPVRKWANPLSVRRAVVSQYQILLTGTEGQVASAHYRAERALSDGEQDPLWPILVVVHQRARDAAERKCPDLRQNRLVERLPAPPKVAIPHRQVRIPPSKGSPMPVKPIRPHAKPIREGQKFRFSASTQDPKAQHREIQAFLEGTTVYGAGLVLHVDDNDGPGMGWWADLTVTVTIDSGEWNGASRKELRSEIESLVDKAAGTRGSKFEDMKWVIRPYDGTTHAAPGWKGKQGKGEVESLPAAHSPATGKWAPSETRNGTKVYACKIGKKTYEWSKIGGVWLDDRNTLDWHPVYIGEATTLAEARKVADAHARTGARSTPEVPSVAPGRTERLPAGGSQARGGTVVTERLPANTEPKRNWWTIQRKASDGWTSLSFFPKDQYREAKDQLRGLQTANRGVQYRLSLRVHRDSDVDPSYSGEDRPLFERTTQDWLPIVYDPTHRQYLAEGWHTTGDVEKMATGVKRTYLGTVGDVNPADYGGGYVIRYGADNTRVEVVEWDSYDDGAKGDLHLVPVPRDVLKEHSWIDPTEIVDSLGTDLTVAEWKKQCTSKDAVVRASCLVDIARYYGWENLDGYPRRVTRDEIRKRWKNRKVPRRGA